MDKVGFYHEGTLSVEEGKVKHKGSIVEDKYLDIMKAQRGPYSTLCLVHGQQSA